MGILGKILGELASPITDLISEVVVDKDKKRELDFKLKEIIAKADERYHEELMGQIEVNKIEAAHSSIFVAGWRPFIGWTGGVGLAYTFVIAPFANQIAKYAGYAGEMVVLDSGTLMTLVLAMLGVGGMRSFDKFQGIDTKTMGKKK